MAAKKSGQDWTKTDINELRTLAAGNTPTRIIGLKLGRSEAGVRGKASSEDISLKPTNQRPYGTSKE
jgi:hypothetical protein